MAELHIEGLDGTAYTLIAYSKALKQKVTHCHLDHAERKAQAFLLNKDIHVG